MGKSLADLRKYLEGSKDAWKPSLTAFAEVDVDQLASDLRITQLAAERRAAAESDSSADLDLAELQIISDIQRRARLARTDYTAAMDMYEARLRDAFVGDEIFVQVKSAAEQGLTNFKAQVEEERIALDAEEARCAAVCKEFDRFTKENRRENFAARVRSNSEVAHGWLWIAALVLLEGLMNGLFFAKGSEGGLLGGALIAVFFSLLNVLLAIAFGTFAWRYARHASLPWRVAGVLCTLILPVLSIMLNLLVGHYRDGYARRGDSVNARDLFTHFSSQPFELADPQSWVLAAIGFAIFAGASWKVFNLFDPYPGFGQIAQRKAAAIAQFDSVRRSVASVLTEHRDIALQEMHAVLNLIRGRRHDYEVAARGRSRLHRSFSEYLRGLESATATLGLMYREKALGGPATTRPRLSARLAPPEPLDDPSPADQNAHVRAIETMSTYIDALSSQYKDAIENTIGRSAVRTSDASA